MQVTLPLLALATAAHGFQVGLLTARPTTALHSILHLSTATEEDAAYVIAKAQECALSDEMSSREEIQFFMNQLVHIQSSCVVGTLAGRNLCENQEQTKMIVAGLQNKLEQLDTEQGQNGMFSSGEVSVGEDGTAVIKTEGPPLAVSLAVLGAVSALVASIV